jgi:hypothetical protein
MHVIRKGQAMWIAKGKIQEQNNFIEKLFGIAAQPDMSMTVSLALIIFATEPFGLNRSKVIVTLCSF